MKKLIFIGLWIFACFNHSNAQLERYKDASFAFSVKQFDEFLDRFNGEVSKELATQIKETNPERGKLIYSLFDSYYAQKNSSLIDDFIRDVTNSSRPDYLDYYATSWYAEVKTNYTYKGKDCKAIIRLKPEVYANNSSKWVVYQIIADDLKPNFKPNEKAVFLSPASNETGFINLYAFFDEPIDPEKILPSNYNYDVTSLFLRALSERQITNIKMHETKYHLYQIDGWYMRVSDYIRNSSNSGWLIDNLIKL